MTNAVRVLVVDDEKPIRRLLRTTLQAQDYDMLEAATAAEALDSVRRERPALVILDLGLPDRDGLDVLRELRAESAVPVIVLSSRDFEAAKVQALDEGADDYVSKPFGSEELMARIRAALRHRMQQQGARPLYRSGPLSVDLIHRRVQLGGDDVHLSPKEYALLEQLVLHAGKVLTHRTLIEAVWDGDLQTDVQYLRIYVRQLRQKLGPCHGQPEFIQTEAGVGYRLRAAD
ncbi:response regulator [Solimonas marina]|uniref:Response regulator transcription factor n=1 Tax=Solimonas marina TaxID=2714601 RepID=A0A969WHC2_9GAMM|nr:response regulator transcription factor [Solimonas marina]NKF24690.1 response regulator transcription factor [Solimonas marina]